MVKSDAMKRLAGGRARAEASEMGLERREASVMVTGYL
jgi:hypothetical protein